jgi:hypothetical protein
MSTVPAASVPNPRYETLSGVPRYSVVPFLGRTTLSPVGAAAISATGAEDAVTLGLCVDVMSTL